MNIRNKMMWIVMSGILLSAIIGTILIYKIVMKQVLATEIANLEKVTEKSNLFTSQRFAESTLKLKSLATLLERELETPVKKDELKTFQELVERHADGILRNQKLNFNGQFEAGMFLPPEAIASEKEKIRHLRIKQVLDVFGAAANKRMENIWYLSPQRSEIIFDKNLPNFAFEEKADNDYTKTPWVTYSTPQINPEREIRFTPPLFDPVPKVWMVSAIYPLYANGEWLGSLGEDMPLTSMLEFMFHSAHLFSNTENFLIDNQGNFVLAGAWQKELESSNEGFKPNLENEPALAELFQKPLTSETKLLTDDLTFHNKRYIVIGGLFDSINWRFYKLVPVSEIMAPTRQLFLNILEMILFVSLLNGLLIFTITGRTITGRIKTLTNIMNEYVRNHNVRVANEIEGKDEIAQVAHAFDCMADDIEARQTELKNSRNQFASLVTNIPGVTYRCALDKDWTMLVMSGLVEELTGYPASDFIHNAVRSYESVIHPDDSSNVDMQVREAVHENRAYVLEYRVVTRCNNIRWVHERGRGVYDENGRVAFLDGFILDVTEHHEVEQELKRSEKKLAIHNADIVQFTNVAAHHLQEPTRRMVSLVQRLEDELTEDAKKNETIALLLRFIEQSAKRQRALVRGIQLYLAAMQPRGVMESVNVSLIVARVLKKYAAKIKEIQAVVEYGELPTVVIDSPRLFDIFDILLENALAYRRLDCSLKIRIFGKMQGDSVHYFVEDNGIGIAPEYRERVFLVFERLQVSENQDSTGIGLATVKRIMDSCNGSVILHETLNGGTTVELEFPFNS
ncbi:MAG: PAS domain-containing protein [Methylococcales bacterium]|nr:PAS domain-containing protein [Methylococcales bacterium]